MIILKTLVKNLFSNAKSIVSNLGIVKILIIALVLCISGWWYSAHRSKKFKANSERHKNNYEQLLEYSNKKVATLTLTHKEFEEQMSDSLSNLLDSLKIKPKRIIEYKTITHHDIDTIYIKANQTQTSDSTYIWSDYSGCFSIKGDVTIIDNFPYVGITEKKYSNNTEYIYYKGKRTKKILWGLFRIGERADSLKIIPECGTSLYKSIKVIK